MIGAWKALRYPSVRRVFAEQRSGAAKSDPVEFRFWSAVLRVVTSIHIQTDLPYRV